MSKTWILSNTHFDHFSIIQDNKRPFGTLKEMNDVLMTNWNKWVQESDTVIFAGNFAFKGDSSDIFHKLKGNKILVKGEYDGEDTLKLPWKSVHDVYDTKPFTISYYPLENCQDSINLYGKNIFSSHSVCVENWEYSPVNITRFLPSYVGIFEGILGGITPVLSGTRIPATAILNFVKAGYSKQEILTKQYPSAPIDSIEVCLKWKDSEEGKKYLEQMDALDELVKLTEEMGLYDQI